MYAVAYGEMFDAISFVGPFETFDEAEAWADWNIGSGNSWWVIELETPNPIHTLIDGLHNGTV